MWAIVCGGLISHCARAKGVTGGGLVVVQGFGGRVYRCAECSVCGLHKSQKCGVLM